ncbi:MAG: acetolactate synthase 3 large subunit [Gammaproteobacteria bacterium]|nr:acetolactate synthase 3 large subunit [Gammaproteobacteria bacterium]
MELSGGEIIVQALHEEGVKTIFGYPGGAVLHIYDAIYKQKNVEHILVRHEQAATHAADGYARATGLPGVCLVTSGPGATNAVTGIATAYMDSIPMVVISGQTPTSMIGTDAFQEADIVGITRPCVKHNFLVTRLEDIAKTIKKAFHIATTGRPGPVLVDIPKDLTHPDIKIPFVYPESVNMRSYQPATNGHPGQIRKAAELLARAERPIIYSGGGVISSNAEALLTEFTRATGYPITNTLMGLGSFPGTDEQFVGMLGMHGSYEANMAMHHCDVMLCVGARFDDRITGTLHNFAPNAKVIHIDIDPATISKNVRAHIPVVGDVKAVLADMLSEFVSIDRTNQPEVAKWWAQINEWRAKDSFGYDREADVIKPQYVVEKFWELTGGDAFICSDVGQHQMYAAQHYKFDKTRRWINSGGLGTMGFGLPAAFGVQLAYPDATVGCVTGEGSIQMCIQELSTCKQYNTPIKILNLNNGYLGMVRQWQEFTYESRYSHSYMDSLPDFVKLAEAYGHVGMQISKKSDVEGALKESLALKDRLVFMDFLVDPTENVYPMIENGKGHHQMRMNPYLTGGKN